MNAALANRRGYHPRMFGAHLSIAGGLHNALISAQSWQSDTVQVFKNSYAFNNGSLLFRANFKCKF